MWYSQIFRNFYKFAIQNIESNRRISGIPHIYSDSVERPLLHYHTSSPMTWIEWFCSLQGNEGICIIPQSFISFALMLYLIG